MAFSAPIMQRNITEQELLSLIDSACSELAVPDRENLCETYGEDEYREANAFRGKSYKEITPDLTKQNWEALYWFYPYAFYYYFLVWARCSVLRLEDANIYLGSMLNLLQSAYSTKSLAWLKERFSLFRSKDIEVMKVWLRWLDQKSSDSFQKKEIKSALQFVEEKPWTTW